MASLGSEHRGQGSSLMWSIQGNLLRHRAEWRRKERGDGGENERDPAQLLLRPLGNVYFIIYQNNINKAGKTPSE